MIQEARVDGNKRRGRMTREITYQRVLLATYMLADDDGLVCDATTAQIAEESGHGIPATQRSIGMMLDRGIVRPIDQTHGLNRRVLVLMDHPESAEYIERTKAEIRAKHMRAFEEQVRRRVDRGRRREQKWQEKGETA